MMPQGGSQADEIEEFLADIVSSSHMSEEKKKELIESLNKAIILNFVNRIFTKLPEANKKAVEEMEFKAPEEVMEFFVKLAPSEDVRAAMEGASSEIFSRFLKKLEK